MPDFRLDGKACLVTGAARGIGRAIALALSDAGADVGTIRELAAHPDIRTSTINTAVSDARLEQAISYAPASAAGSGARPPACRNGGRMTVRRCRRVSPASADRHRKGIGLRERASSRLGFMYSAGWLGRPE